MVTFICNDLNLFSSTVYLKYCMNIKFIAPTLLTPYRTWNVLSGFGLDSFHPAITSHEAVLIRHIHHHHHNRRVFPLSEEVEKKRERERERGRERERKGEKGRERERESEREYWYIIFFTNHQNVMCCIQCVPEKTKPRIIDVLSHNLNTIIINKWHIFGKLRPSSFIWCNSYDAYFTHEWLKLIWREETKKSFGGRYLNFKKKITFIERWVSALSYHASIRKNELGITKFCLFKVELAFP